MIKENKKYEKSITIPIEKKVWKALRIVSFEKEISMNQLCRTAIEKIINKYEKKVDKDE